MEDGAKGFVKEVKGLNKKVGRGGAAGRLSCWVVCAQRAMLLQALCNPTATIIPPQTPPIPHHQVREESCFKGLDQSVKNYLVSIPLIADLRSPAMRDRHWQQLMEATGVRRCAIGPGWRVG